HAEPLWTESGWNLHPATDIGIDSFQADRAPDHVYKTMNLGGIFVRERGKFMAPENKGRYYHDGRFATLLDVVNHYNTLFSLGLPDQDKNAPCEYLKSLTSPSQDRPRTGVPRATSRPGTTTVEPPPRQTPGRAPGPPGARSRRGGDATRLAAVAGLE